MTLPALKALADKAAAGGLNTLLMEWESSFPFQENATLCGPDAFTPEEHKEFIDYCAARGIEVIPLQNCFGHAQYILRHERYASLREDDNDRSQVCPLKVEEARAVFGSIFSEIARAHPSRYMHIGCDETRLLGRCPRCAEKMARDGISRLFVDYVIEMCALVRALGKTPVIWGDMLLQHPEAADLLPKDLIVMDWNYGRPFNRFGDIGALRAKGFEMWGASALRCGPDNIFLTNWPKHFHNLENYLPYCRKMGFTGIVQTSWSTSGAYGYIYDNGHEVIDIQPIRQVYPMSGFDVLQQAFCEAVRMQGPMDAGAFIERYTAAHFGLGADGVAVFKDLFLQDQREVTGRNFNEETIRRELARAMDLRRRLGALEPTKGTADFAHFPLMLDIRINYLQSMALRCEFESPSFRAGQKAALAARLAPVLQEAQRLRRRFCQVNSFYLKHPEQCLNDWTYVKQIENLSKILNNPMIITRNNASAPQRIGCLNWPEAYPYAPDVQFNVWHDGANLYIEYKVNEKTTRALQNVPGKFVHTDSCVEFFIQPSKDDPHYYNFEWNAGGNLYLARRTSRYDPEEAPAWVLESVEAVSSLGPAPFAERAVGGPWTLCVKIPISALWGDKFESWSGLHARANFYKCGDGLQTPHYITWAPIRTSKPEYHSPEFFAPVEFL